MVETVAEVQNIVGQLMGQFEDLRSESGHARSGVGEVTSASVQPQAEAAELKQRIEVLEQENRRLTEVNGEVKGDIGEVSECCSKMKKDLTNLKRKLAKLTEEMRATKLKAEPLAPPATDGAVLPAAEAAVMPKQAKQLPRH
jgi:chromosome segregation ATPase